MFCGDFIQEVFSAKFLFSMSLELLQLDFRIREKGIGPHCSWLLLQGGGCHFQHMWS